MENFQKLETLTIKRKQRELREFPVIKLILLQDELRQVNKHKPSHMKPVKVNAIDKKETPIQDSGEKKTTQSKEQNSVLSSVGDLLPH